MIWFFLAGMVAGAVGMTMYSSWWVRKHTKSIKIQKLDMEDEDDRT